MGQPNKQSCIDTHKEPSFLIQKMEQAPNPRYTKKDSGTYEVEEVEVGSSFTLTKLDETPGPKITTKR